MSQAVLSIPPQLAGTSRGRAIHNDSSHRASPALSVDYNALFLTVTTNAVPYGNTANEAGSLPKTDPTPTGYKTRLEDTVGGVSSYLMTQVHTKVPGGKRQASKVQVGGGRKQTKP